MRYIGRGFRFTSKAMGDEQAGDLRMGTKRQLSRQNCRAFYTREARSRQGRRTSPALFRPNSLTRADHSEMVNAASAHQHLIHGLERLLSASHAMLQGAMHGTRDAQRSTGVFEFLAHAVYEPSKLRERS